MNTGRYVSRIGGIRGRRSLARADLTDAIEKNVVVLPGHVLAKQSIGERHVFAAELRGGSRQEIWRDARANVRERAWRNFLVKVAERVENQQSLDEIRGAIRFQAVDVDGARERRVLGDEPGACAHAAGKEFDVGKIG